MFAFAAASSFVPTLESNISSLRKVQSRAPLRSHVSKRVRVVVSSAGAPLDALLFDCDGVLADTERDAHRVAFNIAFAEKGIDDEWGEALYGKLLETGGGKERMTAHWNEVGWPSGYDDETSRVELVKGLHARKTEVFMDLVSAGKVPLRDGVARLITEARGKGVSVAVCSTSNEKAVAEIVKMLGEDVASDIPIFAGDVVPAKKPDPAIYNLAAKELGLDPAKTCVVEDSFIGLSAAKAAGMTCIVTKSSYTQTEDFAAADRVVDSLEDPFVGLSDLESLVTVNSS